MGVDNLIPEICLTRYFVAAQGYNIKNNSLRQYNKISVLVEKNGKAFSSRRTNNISIWYFFITDRVKKGEVSVLWCPTGDMIVDYMKKLLQRDIFSEFRDQIMGVIPDAYTGPVKVKVEQLRRS